MGYDLTIHEIIEKHAENFPDHIALVSGKTVMRYAELNQQANQIAHYLRKFSFPPDTIIAISLTRSPLLLVGILAILKAGYAYLPIEATYPEDYLHAILEDAASPFLLTETKLKTFFKKYLGEIILLDDLQMNILSESMQNPLLNMHADHLAYVIYTSGSSGKPKGVLISHKSLVNYAKWFGEYSHVLAQDNMDFSSNIIFDMAVTTTVVSLSLGLKIIICTDEIKKDVRKYLAYLNQNKIHFIKLTPSYFKVLLSEAQLQNILLPHLRVIILGGEILYTKDCATWLTLYPEHVLFNEYGPTETTVAVTAFQVNQHNVDKLSEIVPIGLAGLNIDCKLIHDDKVVTASGEKGELHIAGVCLARGYLNQTFLTAKKFIANPFNQTLSEKMYRTGDVCRYTDDGYLEVLQRLDDQVKIRGFRIEPNEIENCLRSHDKIKEVSIIVQNVNALEKKLIAYYIPHENSHLNPQALRNYLLKKLPEYMIPSSFIPLQFFPLNDNGKLDKKSFPMPLLNAEIILPKTIYEKELIVIWQTIFHLENIGVNSHFFELGGHSLIAARLLTEIEKKFSKKISLEDLYLAPTILELANVIAKAESCEQKIEPVVFTEDNSSLIPLGDFQFLFWMSKLFEPKLQTLNIVARRRLDGRLDLTAFNLAAEWLFNKHQILSYEIVKWYPGQFLKKSISFAIDEIDLSRCAETEMEALLTDSLNELISHKDWHRSKPLLQIKYFLLANDVSEIQIAASHFSFDDASEQILFNELSAAYLYFTKQSSDLPILNASQYKDFVLHEKRTINQQLEKDISFWEHYLSNATLLYLPDSVVLNHMKNVAYTTYFDFSHELMQKIDYLCKHASLSLTDIFCAATTLTFKKLAESDNHEIYMNITRSVRENTDHDNMIGCFLRFEPIKVDLRTRHNLIDYAKVIQQSRLRAEPYQRCASMLKLACINNMHQKNHLKKFFIKIFSHFYCKVFYKLKINPLIIMMYSRLSALRKRNQFVINMNLFHNIIEANEERNLFGHRLQKTQFYQYDVSNFDNILDICLFKKTTQNKTYLTISCNLQPSFRQQAGQEMIKILEGID